MADQQRDPDSLRSQAKTAHAKTPQAQRALDEAAERHRDNARPTPATPEINGRNGPEPVRYGDWENKGIASDF